MHKDKLFSVFFTGETPSIHVFAANVDEAFAIARTYGTIKSLYEEKYVTEKKSGQ